MNQNRLVITKNGFYKQSETITGDISEFATSCGMPVQISFKFVSTLNTVVKIMTNQGLPKKSTLYFPERHYPRNAGQVFWEKVKKRMKEDYIFEVFTSDIIAAGFIPNLAVNTSYKVGWNVVLLEKGKNKKIINPRLYGRDIKSLMYESF